MATDNPAKKLKLDGPLIGTHSGHFHADEALAVSMLRLLPTYAASPLVRTRDPAVLATCHTVVDVGAEYDDARKRYDHHQREFTTTFPGHTTKLSSAGLVFMHYGKDAIAALTSLAPGPDLDLLYEKIYTDLIEAFDANDNGVSAIAPKDLEAAGLKAKFSDRGFSIASVVNRYNYTSGPSPTATTKDAEQQEEDARFLKASLFVGEQFELEVTDRARAWLPARHAVAAAYTSRLQYDASGRILVLGEGMPWADHLYNLEKEAAPQPDGVAPHVLYALFPESTAPDTKWRIRAVSKENSGFENRKDLPDAWKGVRDEELDKVSGIPGCVFVHAAGFIGGNKTFDGALAMARKALEL
ncbi:metal-dependent protein hydrolase [Massariosphaeria phaeospora]|uniref:Metal-dependent protein hydrolase n=1 Tax=Massariosphaeria phaeospora TaxID=100035 RepID=A0A7C8M9T8_9PLEO|nr:metal-dependent protein hydrolase [Massariosphaeria phaeospora]